MRRFKPDNTMNSTSGLPLVNSKSLIELISNIAKSDGDYTTPIPSLMIYRRSEATVPMPCIFGLGLGITVQGGKRVTLGEEIFDYGPAQALVTSIDLPVTSYVTHATPIEPYLGIRLELDARTISQLVSEMNFPLPLKPSRAMSMVTLDEGMLDALTRLTQLLDEPNLIPHIAPLIQQEIIVRLLSGEHGSTLKHLVTIGAPSQQITKVINWMKSHFTEDIPIDDLATKASMSPSTFRQHFRVITGMSPLQYLKQLRLQDARQLMLNEDLDASSAAVRVGYESASQFSREYTRLFGAPPLRDIKQMREAY